MKEPHQLQLYPQDQKQLLRPSQSTRMDIWFCPVEGEKCSQ